MSESNISGKIKRKKGQRGPDREHREFNPKSLSNLKQFQKSVSEASLSVNSDVNLGINWSKVGMMVTFVAAISVLIWKLYQRKHKPD